MPPRRLSELGIPLRTVSAGDAFALDPHCRLRVLHPVAVDAEHVPPSPIPERPPGRGVADNERSIVLAVESAGRRLLLTGDLEGPALARFIAAGPGGCDVLVAPHHGSRSSLPPDIARVTSPTWVLVSGQGGAAWPEVRAAYGAASAGGAARVLKTGGEGAIAIEADAAAVTVRRFAAGRWRTVSPASQEWPAAASAPVRRRSKPTG